MGVGRTRFVALVLRPPHKLTPRIILTSPIALRMPLPPPLQPPPGKPDTPELAPSPWPPSLHVKRITQGFTMVFTDGGRMRTLTHSRRNPVSFSRPPARSRAPAAAHPLPPSARFRAAPRGSARALRGLCATHSLTCRLLDAAIETPRRPSRHPSRGSAGAPATQQLTPAQLRAKFGDFSPELGTK